ALRLRGGLPLGPEGERACDIAAKPFEEAEVIRPGDAERMGHRVPLRLLREQAREERPGLTAIEGFKPLGERDGNGRTRGVADPIWVIDELKVAVVVDLEQADASAVPPDGQRLDHRAEPGW